MLDTDTKRRIDTARDILVGKVPDPKSQVEQITIALIYKFMDDMDAESEELGGHRKFFANGFARYGWAKLMHSGLGGHETLNLYAEAIAKMPENPGIPLLFRDIFKNAYLPYRDPETLRAFLKVIDEFEYDHSERLGDAFEYLLSVLGSQGDAGQFRTPRHIIDFIVAVVDPRKTETVLDPACGTAGFLISSYKHILKANVGADGHSTLTPDERGRLAQNFKGYDISPDMVRLSLVNLYLHGFTDPHIFEYDTLTSQERWNEYADVILANPPFMSPKGGIKPHNRFSVQSKRSEVLFVDYMAEHLTPGGRAGIIVPEGVIFQSQTAYSQLRKMLVEEYLVAVVSLPAGVFNPYSGVKTSILILEKSLARQAQTIGFFKIENDGLGLGAQRRKIDKNDLPQARTEIAEYLRRLRAQESVEEYKPTLGLVVPKERIAASGDYNLSGERYQAGVTGQTRVPMVRLGDLAELIRGMTFSKSDQLERASADSLSVATTKAAQEAGIVDDDLYHIPRQLLKDETKLLRPGDILISTANSLNLLGRTTHVRKVDRPMSFGAFMSLIRPNKRILDGYLIHCLRTPYAADFYVRNANTTTNISNLNLSALAEFHIPLPPLEVQRELVAEIDGYQKVIDGARAVLDNYCPHIPIHPDWPMVPIREVLRKSEDSVLPESLTGPVTYVGLENISQGTGEICGRVVSDDPSSIKSLKNVFNAGEILYGKLRPSLNKVWLADRSGICSTDIIVIQPVSNKVLSGFYSTILRSEAFNSAVMTHIKGAQLPRVSWSSLALIHVPLPPLATQQTIVSEIEAEQALIAANRELVARFENKIQATLARVWGEEA